MVDIRRDDRPPCRNFRTHELCSDEVGKRSAERFTIAASVSGTFARSLPPQVLAIGDIDHFLGDDASSSEIELGHKPPGSTSADRTSSGAGRHQTRPVGEAVILWPDGTRRLVLEPPELNPRTPDSRQPGS